MIRLEVGRLPASNASRNVAWYVKAKERKAWAVLLRAALGRQPKPSSPWPIARVVFTRYSSREPDSDNLAASFKLCRDLLQPAGRKNPGGLGIIAGDGPEQLVAEYGWEATPRGAGRIVIEASQGVAPERAAKGPRSDDLAEWDPEDGMGSQYG